MTFHVDESSKLNKIDQESKIKQILINFVYSHIKLSNFHYNELKQSADLSLITSSNYVIMPNYVGMLSLLVFMRNKDRYYSFVINKQTLPENKENLVLENVKIWPVKLNLNYRIYDGSIFEGITYFIDKRPGVFILNDMFYFQGVPQFNELMKYKMINLGVYFNKYLKKTDKFKIYLNEFYQMEDIDDAVKMLIRRKMPISDNIVSLSNITIIGLIFYPNLSNQRIVFNKPQEHNNTFLNKLFDKEENEQPQIQPIIQETKPQIQYEVINPYQQIKLTFLMKKTTTPDNYKLFLLSDPIKNSLNMEAYHTIFIGYAYISTKEQSLYWYNIFSKEQNKMVECIYIVSKNLWTPSKVANPDIKKPDFMKEYLKYFKVKETENK